VFIDEITAITGWQKAIKRLADRGVLRQVLIITTGSKAGDIQREAELLPGRKGKLARTIYLFAQLPYKIFHDKAFPTLKAQTLPAYLIAGGSPPACAAVLETGAVPEYVFQTTADWIYGECALAGRSRPMLLRLLEQLMRRGASPVAQTTLAQESGMANNTVAHGYLDLLGDLLVLGACEPWDPARNVRVSRKSSKYPFSLRIPGRRTATRHQPLWNDRPEKKEVSGGSGRWQRSYSDEPQKPAIPYPCNRSTGALKGTRSISCAGANRGSK
jgi:predicted AAA+ superfamily ATPase